MRSVWLAVALAFAQVGAANAQTTATGNVPVQQFAPAPGGDTNYVTVQGSSVLPHLMPSFGLYLNYAYEPLILTRLSTGEEVKLLEHQLQADLLAALGLFDFAELGVAMPLTLWQSAGDNGDTLGVRDLDGFVAGDLRLYPKFRLIDNEGQGFGLAALALVTLPTGSQANYQGNASVTAEPRVVGEYAFNERGRIAGSVGVLLREDQELFNIQVGHELTWGASFAYRFAEVPAALIGEVYGKRGLSDADSEETPAELSVAGRWWPVPLHALTLGVSRGLTEGYGSPAFRAYVAYQFTPETVRDSDGDGILDDVDACPNEPEDKDGFQDDDGCPDLDNDGDGIPDTSDKCPNEAEDKDGFQDDDGCPDVDNDGDGILDDVDACPNEAEDKDGFQDDDGCPDVDNDGDGILDDLDKCPTEAEDMDGFEDLDGCPDVDNDGDGLLDDVDPCPNDATNKCGIQTETEEEIVILDQIQFEYNRDVIKPVSFPILDSVADVLKTRPRIRKLEIQGHTDAHGDDAFNMDLSQRRANAVRAYLVDKHGIDASRLEAKGYGETKPIASNRSPAGRAKNRRVQFVVLDATGTNGN